MELSKLNRFEKTSALFEYSASHFNIAGKLSGPISALPTKQTHHQNIPTNQTTPQWQSQHETKHTMDTTMR